MLQVEGKKMSKSLGNFFTVRDLLDGNTPDGTKYPGEVIRFVLLRTHYRQPINWMAEVAREAEGHLRKWRSMTSDIAPTLPDSEFVDALADDLNTSQAIFRLHALAGNIATFRSHEAALGANYTGRPSVEAAGEFLASAQMLGLLLHELGEWANDPEIDLSAQTERLSSLRAAAMASKDFSAVDALKSALIAAGVEVRMSKAGVELVPGPDFDPAKLEVLQ